MVGLLGITTLSVQVCEGEEETRPFSRRKGILPSTTHRHAFYYPVWGLVYLPHHIEGHGIIVLDKLLIIPSLSATGESGNNNTGMFVIVQQTV